MTKIIIIETTLLMANKIKKDHTHLKTAINKIEPNKGKVK